MSEPSAVEAAAAAAAASTPAKAAAGKDLYIMHTYIHISSRTCLDMYVCETNVVAGSGGRSSEALNCEVACGPVLCIP